MARVSSSSEPEALSLRERRVLKYLVRGYTFADVAGTLGLPVAQIECLHENICRKLDLRGRPTVYEYAVAVGLVGPNGKA